MSIRTRFAPSPTGYIHVGNVRAALFPWLLARQSGGTFILRIEDTDQARFVEGATDLIVETLQWLGLSWDEGIVVGGSHGPYIQTERKEHYVTWAEKLIEKGLAYADPYSPEEVEVFRAEAKAQKRAFLYRNYRPENPPKWDGSQPLRFKVPTIKRYSWNDPVMGELSAGEDALDDFILIKSDGLPTYNFAHIVDDTEMEVTHVIRGLEYIASIPKYLSLYEALEITPPVLACLPHIMAPDGKKKLGKRDGAKSVSEYRDEGILPETMLNFLASMGWNDGTEQEIFSVEELIDKFSLDRVQRSGARFDEKRLLWMNGQWIRKISPEKLSEYAKAFWSEKALKVDETYRQQVLMLVADRLKVLSELPMMSDYFFTDPDIDIQQFSEPKQLKDIAWEEQKELLSKSIEAIESLTVFDEDTIQKCLNQLLVTTRQKPAVLFSIIRIAVSMAPFSPALHQTLALLGKETTLRRLKKTIT